MGAFLFLLTSFLLIAISVILMRGTTLDISDLRRNPFALLWYLQLILVSLPVVIVTAKGIKAIKVLYVSIPGSEIEIGVITLLTLFLYVVSLAVFLRVFRLRLPPQEDNRLSPSYLRRLLMWMTLAGIAIIILFSMLGYHHALLSSLLNRRSLLAIRLANKYHSSVPSQLAPIVLLVGWTISILSGYMYRIRQRAVGIFYIIVGLILVTMPGDKAPILLALILWYLAAGIGIPKRAYSPKILLIIVALISVLGYSMFFMLARQQPDLDLASFLSYLLNRIGVGQMAGVYETFGLASSGSFPGGDYYLHAIPGAKAFYSYIDYQKMLMMVTEGYGYSEMGVKNTYFIAEAYAMGGYPLVWLSPVVVAFSSAMGLWVLRKYMRLLSPILAPHLALAVYMLSHNITGGFASFPLLKGMLLLIPLLSIVIVPVGYISKISFFRVDKACSYSRIEKT